MPHPANDLVPVASLIGDPARASILSWLMDGTARTAGELARAAKVTPQTASSHLGKLVAGGLLAVEPQGRHRYYRLAGPEVGHALEALSLLSPAQGWATRAPPALRFARTCYDHLAGWLGVAVAQGLERKGYLVLGPEAYEVTEAGSEFLRALGVDASQAPADLREALPRLERAPPPPRRLPGQSVHRLPARPPLPRGGQEPRSLRLTTTGRAALERDLGLRLDSDAVPA